MSRANRSSCRSLPAGMNHMVTSNISHMYLSVSVHIHAILSLLCLTHFHLNELTISCSRCLMIYLSLMHRGTSPYSTSDHRHGHVGPDAQICIRMMWMNVHRRTLGFCFVVMAWALWAGQSGPLTLESRVRHFSRTVNNEADRLFSAFVFIDNVKCSSNTTNSCTDTLFI